MRRIAAWLLILPAIPALAEAPKPFSVFARSQHYSINVEGVPLNGHTEYNVTVVDLATNAVVAQPHMTVNDEHRVVTNETDSGDKRIRVAIRYGSPRLSAALEVSQAEMVIDSMTVTWATEPYPRSAAMSGGVVGGVVAHPSRPLPADTYRVGGDVHAPRVIHRVEPLYNEEARRARISGIVIVEAMIDKTGVVRDVTVLKPLPYGLDQAAVDAVKQWRFEPGTKDGQPVNVIFNMTVNFALATPPPPQPHP